MAGRYLPVLELTVLLELKGLRLSHFHLTKDGDWSFVLSGNRAKVTDWTREIKAHTKTGLGRKGRLQTFVVLALGVILGVMIVILIVAFTFV